MKVQGIPESCDAFDLKRDDASFHFPIFFSSDKNTGIESQEEPCRTQTSHDPKSTLGGHQRNGKSKSKSYWQSSAVEDAGQSSHDSWMVIKGWEIQTVNWVCEDALDDQEWVSELTISIEENEVFVALNYEIDVPCVVQ